MALIVPHQSQQGIQTANGGQAAQYRSASAFTTPGQENLGRGLQQLAQGMNKLGGVIFDAEIQKRQEQMELTLLEDMQKFQMESQAWSDNYQKNFQGKDAVNAEADAQTFYKEKVDSLRQRWNGNERAQLYIQRNAGGVAVSGVNSMRDYGNKQQEVWKDSVFAGEESLARNILEDWRTPLDKWMEAEAGIRAKHMAYARSKGIDPTEAMAKHEAFIRDVTEKRMERGFIEKIGSGDLVGAEEYLRSMKGKNALPAEVQALAAKEAEAQGVPTELVLRVIAAESGGRADAVSNHGARGLMQLMPGTAKELGVNPDDPADNVKGGVTYLKQMLGKYEGNKKLALMAYNWGPGNVDKWLAGGQKGAVPAETSGYAGKILGGTQLGAATVRPEKMTEFEKMYQTAMREELKTSSISRYGEQFPDNPDKAARAALQDSELAKDPQTQRSVVEYFDWQSRQLESAQKQFQLAQLNQSYESIYSAAEKRDIPAINKIIMEASPENMPKLQNFANRVVNGDGLISDPVAFDDMVARINEGQPVQIEAEYGNSLSLKDLRRGKDMIARRDLAQYRVQEKVAFEEEAKKYQPNIKAGDISALFRQFEASIPDGGYKDQTQRQKSLTAFWRKVTVDKPWRFSESIYGFEAKKYAEKGYYLDVGQDYLELPEYQEFIPKIKEAIKKRDGVEREPSKAELARAWQLFHSGKTTVDKDWSIVIDEESNNGFDQDAPHPMM